jgi:hypothetical protein
MSNNFSLLYPLMGFAGKKALNYWRALKVCVIYIHLELSIPIEMGSLINFSLFFAILVHFP